jgi:hypothetical protein
MVAIVQALVSLTGALGSFRFFTRIGAAAEINCTIMPLRVDPGRKYKRRKKREKRKVELDKGIIINGRN